MIFQTRNSGDMAVDALYQCHWEPFETPSNGQSQAAGLCIGQWQPFGNKKYILPHVAKVKQDIAAHKERA